jgi:predicted porin
MKKSLVALAALAATSAFAQSSVTLSGNVDAAYASISYKGQKVSGITNNGSSTSTIQLSGTEDLGGGLKANFKLNSDFNVASTNGNAGYGGVATVQAAGTTTTTGAAGSSGSWLNSEQFIGLSGGFGTVQAGVVNNLSLSAGGTGNPFGTAIGSGFRALYNTDVIGTMGAAGTAGSVVRYDHSIKYISPAINGFSLALYNVSKNDKASSDAFSTTFGNYDRAGVTETALNYNQGPINVSYASQSAKGRDISQLNASTGVLVNTTLNTLGANYTFGNTTAYLLNQTSEATTTSATTRDTKYTSFGVKHVMGATTLLAQMGTLSNDVTNTADKSKLTGLGADYALSKRTNAYFRYESIDDKNGYVANPSKLAAVTGDNKRTRTAIGVRHSF